MLLMIVAQSWRPPNFQRSLSGVSQRVWLLSGLLALAGCGNGTSGWVLSDRVPPAAIDAGPEGGASGLGGSAGQAGDDAPGGNTAGGATIGGDRCPARFAALCSPSIVVDNKDAAGSGQLFTTAIDDPSTTLSCITRDVCNMLYRKASEIRNVGQVSVIVEDYDGVSEAWAPAPGQAVIHLSSRHLQQVADAHGDVTAELHSIFYYHATNIYQFDDGNGTANAWLISGVANYVRHVAGYMTDSQRKPGGAYNDGGATTGFFFVWLDQKYPDFVYELNLSLDPNDNVAWTTKAFQDITGQSVAVLWADYQATL